MLNSQAERLDADTGTDGENGQDNGPRPMERPRLSLRDRPMPGLAMDVTGVVPMSRARRAKAGAEPSWPPPPRPRIVFRRDETAEA